jgi:predicted nucleotidyltransferase
MELNQTHTARFAKERFQAQEQWMLDNLVLECVMGSHAYGCQTDTSDYDVVGVVMDQHMTLYPQSYGYVLGFDPLPNFRNKEVKGEGKRLTLENGKDCEGAWHSLTDFFNLVENGSPALTEVLFVRQNLVTYRTKVGDMMRDNRKLFLSMKMFHSFKGYCFQQLSRLRNGVKRWNTEHKCDNSNRQVFFEKYGYDVKMSYHCLRLLDLVDQLLKVGDFDLMRNRDECKAMRAGTWGDWPKFENFVDTRLKELEGYALNNVVAVPNRPQHEPLHNLLVSCLEEWYGSEKMMQKQNTEYVSAKMVMDKLDQILNKKD